MPGRGPAAAGSGLPDASLATSPGGTHGSLIIAASLHVDLLFVPGAQLMRFLLVLGLDPLVARKPARAAQA